MHSSRAIDVKKSTGETVGNVLDKLVLTPLLESGQVQTITGLSRGASEGVWVQGGGVVISCNYILLGRKVNKPFVRGKLREKAKKKRKRSQDEDQEEKKGNRRLAS